MESYPTENEQIDTARRFFVENGKVLAVGVVLGIGALIGWSYWQSYQNTVMTQVSSSWQQVSTALLTNKAQGVTTIEQFAESNKNNYGALASLQLAHYFVENNKFSQAEQKLKQAVGYVADDNLSSLINLRLARVQLQQKKPDEALKTLAGVTAEGGWGAIAQSVRGDAMLSKGDVDGARDAYSNGIKSNVSAELQVLLRMKLNNLSG